MFDRRAMEKTMADLARLIGEQEFGSEEEANAFLHSILASGAPPASKPRTPVEEAQDLMYDAWDATGRQRVRLARQALKISPDCADAYVLLAEEAARSLEEARDLYQQGVEAGERALGLEAFEEDAGSFWGILGTRPYMRARLGLAQCLWALAERQAAIEHYRTLLHLNPDDNQGVRYLLASALLEEGMDEELGELLARYEDDAMASWAYIRALWLFRRHGPSPQADASLREAVQCNRSVSSYLLGRKRLPQHSPEYVVLGGESEAIDCAAANLAAWRKTPGALEWLADLTRQ